MELCYTDFELLQSVEREIFTDSIEGLKKFEELMLTDTFLAQPPRKSWFPNLQP